MTTTAHEDQFTPAPVEVTRGDKDRAAKFISESDGDFAELAALFAAHRIAHSAPAGEVEPVAWMYHHADLQEYEFIKTQALRDRCKQAGYFPADAGWTETPLYTHPAPPADVGELVEALDILRGLAAAYKLACDDLGKPYYEAQSSWYSHAQFLLAKHGGA